LAAEGGTSVPIPHAKLLDGASEDASPAEMAQSGPLAAQISSLPTGKLSEIRFGQYSKSKPQQQSSRPLDDEAPSPHL